MVTWDFNDQQANFLDVLEMAQSSGPQRIKRGDKRLYVVSESDWQAANDALSALGAPQSLRKTG